MGFSDFFDCLIDFYDYLFDRFDKSLNKLKLNIIMPRIITLEEKHAVIDDWLDGESRNDIAVKRYLASGTVYNIIQEWRIGIGIAKADKLRDLAVKLNKTGVTVNDCAKGLRTLMIFKKYGIKEEGDDQEQLIYFLREIYTKCQEVEFKPQQVFDYISDILKFSSDIAITQIPHYIKTRTEEKEKLEREIQEFSEKIDELKETKEEIEQDIQQLRHLQGTMTKNYNMFMIAIHRLKKYGVEIENIDHLVNCVIGISKQGANPVHILAKVAEYEKLEADTKYYISEVNHKKEELSRLNQDINIQKNNLSYIKIKVDTINELENRGFGITELRILINIINEIGLEHKHDYDEIRKQFFEDLKKNYEEVIGSRKEIDRLKKELKILEEQTMKEREKYNSYPKVIESIRRLAGSRISEEDIVYIDRILSMTDYYLYKDKRLYKKGLIDDLQKYGNLKLAIKNLENMERDLKSTKKTHDKPTKKKTRHSV
jgi:DNA repair exonuclease SbcCD ATPase subunit